jgi:hypothetical protein
MAADPATDTAAADLATTQESDQDLDPALDQDPAAEVMAVVVDIVAAEAVAQVGIDNLSQIKE